MQEVNSSTLNSNIKITFSGNSEGVQNSVSVNRKLI